MRPLIGMCTSTLSVITAAAAGAFLGAAMGLVLGVVVATFIAVCLYRRCRASVHLVGYPRTSEKNDA